MSDPNQFLLYTAPNGAVNVEVFFKDETVWLTQKALAELFGVNVPGINKGFVLDDQRLKQGKQVFGKDYRKRQDAEYISDFDREIRRIEAREDR